MLGFGWCHLRSSRQSLEDASLDDLESIDLAIDQADRNLWVNFREWMEVHTEIFLQWQLHESLNNHHGLLTYCVSRNHRSSNVWRMLEWIASNGPGSYGLFYCHDDEDTMDRGAYNREVPMDYDNVYRVHRILNGKIIELSDPYFGNIEGNIDPIHPFNRTNNEE
ncbi:MAG: hypothetical protein KDA68_10915 [Planctomycetaceae bacterium]|nr:hypothetical protein [Planctomycetaceae bacterium]